MMRRFFWAVVVTLFVSRNYVSRVAAEWMGSSVLGTRVNIGAVYIGWGTIRVREVAILEPRLSDAPQVEIAQIDVESSIISGFKDGKWIRSVGVDRPRFHLHFDQHGNLVSEFPQSESRSESGEISIPLRSLFVSGARVIIHQGDRSEAIVDRAQLACQFGDRIDIRGRVGQLIGGSVQFHSNVDAIHYAGKSVLQVADCKLNCESLPGRLLPRKIRDQRISGCVALHAEVQHPAGVNDPRLHPIRLAIRLNDLEWGDIGKVISELSVAATTGMDGARVAVNANPFDSDAQLNATTDSLTLPLTVEVVSRVGDCDLEPIIAHFAPDVDGHAVAGLSTQSHFRVTAKRVDFQNEFRADLTDLSVERTAVKDVKFRTRCDGSLAFGEGNADLLDGLSGLLKGSITTQGVELAQLAPIVGVPDLTGRVSSSTEFELPLERLTDLDAAHVDAVAVCENIGGAGCRIGDTKMNVSVASGNILARTGEVHIVGSDGSTLAMLDGEAHTTLTDQQLTLHGRLEVPDAKTIGKQFAFDKELLRGSAKVLLSASAEIPSAAKPESWSATAKLETSDVVVAGESIDDVLARCDLRDGVLTIAPTILKWRQNVCQFGLNGVVNQDLSVDGQLAAGPIHLKDLADVASRFSNKPLAMTGQAALSGRLHVDTKKAEVAMIGKAVLLDATFAATEIGSAELAWWGNRNGFKIQTGSNDFLGGRYSLAATATKLDWTQATVESQFSGIKASRIPRFAQIELPVEGELSGGFQLTSLGSLNDLSGHAWLESSGLAVQSVPIQISQAEVRIADGEAALTTSGDLLRGSFDANGRANLVQLMEFTRAERPDLRQLPILVDAKLRGLSIAQAVKKLRLPNTLRPLSGSIDATCIRDPSSIRDGLICTATASAESLRWNHATLTNRATATIDVQPTVVRLTSIEGRLADGRLSGRAELFFDGHPHGVFDVGVDRMNLRRATAPLGRTANDVSGTGSVRLTGRIGSNITGRLDLSANNPSMSDLNIRTVRFPIDWTVSPTSAKVNWRCRAGVIDAGEGKIHVSTEGSFDRSLNMRLSAKLNRIDTSRLLRSGSFGAGIVSGQVNLQAKRAKDPKQIVGNFDITMSQVDSLEMPVLDQLDTLVSMTPTLGSKQNNDGTLRGRLAGGLVHVEELSVTQSNVQVMMNGHASLDGRLKFDITAATGQAGPADGLVGLAESPLMLAAPAPVALVLKANEAMKDRVVHVRVEGTASRPILRLQPGKTLTQDTLRFFIANSFGSRVANLADQSQRRKQSR